MRTSTVFKALLAVSAVTPLLCQAESTFNNGGGSPATATARVDFQITIPKFVFLRVGNGTGTVAGGWATQALIDQITWAPTAAQVGTNTLAAPMAGTGGDLGGGTETAVVVANNGNVSLSSTTLGALNDGAAGDTITYAKIVTTASKNTTATILAAPALADAATTTITLTAVGKIVQQDAKWAYGFANDFIPPAGTYGGVNANNSRVTYTASVP